jgi:dTDP-4-amino-4,6-dideoxygalactose transaminase
VFNEVEDNGMLEAVRSGKWNRYDGKQVLQFEKAYAEKAGAKHCVATNSGTSSLYASLGALGIGPGDEVILPPYTFLATYNVITLNYALPIFVDVDPETSQIDANKIESAITPNTKAIIPVHLGGNTCDMDKIVVIGRKHNIPIIEDACQSHLAEWRGKMVGNWGLGGCFSFQASKNLNCGDGGAIITNDDEFASLVEGFQDQGRPKKGRAAEGFGCGTRGANLRMTEFQGALLVAQMTRIEEQAKRRAENAEYLAGMLKQIPGVLPQMKYEGCTRHAYHLFTFRYKKEQFGGLSRDKFIQAMIAEGIHDTGPSYNAWQKQAHVNKLLEDRHFQKLYSKQTLDRWNEHRACPQNDILCAENVRFTQTMLLGQRSDMDHIVAAIRKIQKFAPEIAS